MSERPPAPLSRRKKFLFSLVPVLILLALAEGSLRLAGYQSPVADPYESFVLHRPLFEADGGVLRTSPARESYFHRQQLARSKGPGVRRYFAFGGSDTFGFGLDDWGRDWYGAVLARRLGARFAPTRFEAVNCGGIAYASYRLRGLVEECLDYQPDLVIVLSGHNEFLEARRYADLRRPRSALARAWYDLRLVRLGQDLAHRLSPPAVLSADFVREQYVVRDEGEQRQTLDHYVWNLNRIADGCRQRGVPLVLCTSPANLRDWPPFLTEPADAFSEADLYRRLRRVIECRGPEEFTRELGHAREVLARAPRAAGYHYVAARCLDALGRREEARSEYVLAKDTDTFPHRARSSFNEAVRALARERKGRGEDVELFDAEALFARASADGIPGKDLFTDHCHPNREGHRLLARGLEELVAARAPGSD